MFKDKIDKYFNRYLHVNFVDKSDLDVFSVYIKTDLLEKGNLLDLINQELDDIIPESSIKYKGELNDLANFELDLGPVNRPEDVSIIINGVFITEKIYQDIM